MTVQRYRLLETPTAGLGQSSLLTSDTRCIQSGFSEFISIDPYNRSVIMLN